MVTFTIVASKIVLICFDSVCSSFGISPQTNFSLRFFSSIFRCTLTKIPESNSLLQKSRLPLGILIHPFRDLNVSKCFLFFLFFSLCPNYSNRSWERRDSERNCSAIHPSALIYAQFHK